MRFATLLLRQTAEKDHRRQNAVFASLRMMTAWVTRVVP
jgi:hypothetical protein